MPWNSVTMQSGPCHSIHQEASHINKGCVTRYCQQSWLDKNPFLHYDVAENTCMFAVEQKKIRKAKEEMMLL